MNAIEFHERALTFRSFRGRKGIPGLLDMPHVTVCGELNDLTVQDPCLVLNVKGITSAEVVAYLGQNGIRVHNRYFGRLFSPHFRRKLFTRKSACASPRHTEHSLEEIDFFLEAM